MITDLTLVELSRMLKGQELSPLEVTNACLELITTTDRILGAYVRVLADEALLAAKRA